MDIKKIILNRDSEHIDLFLNAFSILSNPEDAVQSIKHHQSRGSMKDIDLNMAQFGTFDNNSLFHAVNAIVRENHKGGLSFFAYGHILRALEENFLAFRPTDFSWKLEKSIYQLHKSGHLRFLILGFPEIVKTLNRAVVAINVADDFGDQNCGSGMIINGKIPGIGIIVTNSHVLKNKIIKDINNGTKQYTIISDIIHHDKFDLAKFYISIDENDICASLSSEVEVLDEVIALGYPRVPTASVQFMTAHTGQVNGRFKTIDDQDFIAISCHVSPGNSGGPIFNRMGYCSGIVTQSGTAEFGSSDSMGGTYRSQYHMAIPVNIIRDFVLQPALRA